MTSRPKASLDAKWLVKEPCGTPAAWTMSRTLAPAKPRSCTTRMPSVRIFSRLDGLDIRPIWPSIVAGQERRRSGDADIVDQTGAAEAPGRAHPGPAGDLIKRRQALGIDHRQILDLVEPRRQQRLGRPSGRRRARALAAA